MQHFEAKRAKAAAVRTVPSGSHAVFVSEPGITAAFIEKAART